MPWMSTAQSSPCNNPEVRSSILAKVLGSGIIHYINKRKVLSMNVTTNQFAWTYMLHFLTVGALDKAKTESLGKEFAKVSGTIGDSRFNYMKVQNIDE